LPPAAREVFILSLTKSMKQRHHDRELQSVLDLARIIESLDDDNGHAFYYAGEAYRSLQNRTNMRGSLQHYLAEATNRPDSVTGGAAQCYERPHGYCGERTEWINHLMANDYAADADTTRESRRADLLLTAYRYEHHVVETRPLGFYGLQTVKSSCELLAHVREQMRAMKRQIPDLENDLKSLRCGTQKL
jgi:hypothetical protein